MSVTQRCLRVPGNMIISFLGVGERGKWGWLRWNKMLKQHMKPQIQVLIWRFVGNLEIIINTYPTSQTQLDLAQKSSRDQNSTVLLLVCCNCWNLTSCLCIPMARTGCSLTSNRGCLCRHVAIDLASNVVHTGRFSLVGTDKAELPLSVASIEPIGFYSNYFTTTVQPDEKGCPWRIFSMLISGGSPAAPV